MSFCLFALISSWVGRCDAYVSRMGGEKVKGERKKKKEKGDEYEVGLGFCRACVRAFAELCYAVLCCAVLYLRYVGR